MICCSTVWARGCRTDPSWSPGKRAASQHTLPWRCRGRRRLSRRWTQRRWGTSGRWTAPPLLPGAWCSSPRWGARCGEALGLRPAGGVSAWCSGDGSLIVIKQCTLHHWVNTLHHWGECMIIRWWIVDRYKPLYTTRWTLYTTGWTLYATEVNAW